MSNLKVIRVSSLPTKLNPGSGLAALHLSNWKSFNTTVFSYYCPVDSVGIHDFKLYLLKFYNPSMPKKRSGFFFIFLQLKRIYCLVSFFLKFCFTAKLSDVNIIHIHSPLHILIAWWGMLFKIPTIVSIHGTDSVRILGSRFYRILFSPVKQILCVSSVDVEKFQNAYPKSCARLISNGVDYDFFKPKKNHSDENTIIACGSLRWHKDFETLLTACADIFTTLDDWKLKIIGEGKDRSKLERLISSYGMENRISLLGVLERNSVAEQFRKAKIFVISSVTEGLPKVLLEAMASKCACVSTDVGDCRRILDGCGIVVPKQNPQRLSVALLELMNEDDLRVGLANAGQLVASGYSWDNYCRKHDQIYRSILS
jgi:glycosyltransferase involved in cell wall biosynthesis